MTWLCVLNSIAAVCLIEVVLGYVYIFFYTFFGRLYDERKVNRIQREIKKSKK